MTNTIITITIENEEQKNAIIEALDKAEKSGELDFAFGVQVGAEALVRPVGLWKVKR